MRKSLLLLWIAIFLTSCEEVVDVELQESAPRLVVEASLLWDKEADEGVQTIRLSTTAPFFDEEIPPAEGAEVRVTDPDGTTYYFEETKPGIYQNNLVPQVLDGQYALYIAYEGAVYEATERFVSTPSLEEVVQKDKGGFSGNDTEFQLFYTDPIAEENFYLFRFFHNQLALQIYTDEFTNGSRTFAFFREEDIEPGDKVSFEIQGISESFYEYLFILRSQSGTAGGPFQTQPTIVRGNIVNTSDKDNFAFGYFRLSQVDSIIYTVE